MLKALLWKDARILGEVILAGIALIGISYLFAFLLVCSEQGRSLEWSKVIGGGASLTRFTSLLLSALLGAYAFSRENEDRSSLFLSYLPASRPRIAASKLAISVASLLLLWLASLAVLVPSMRAMGFEADAIGRTLKAMAGYIAAGILVFGISWLLSRSSDSVVLTALAGLASLLPVCVLQFAANWHFEVENPAFFGSTSIFLMTATGAAGVTLGTARFLRKGCASTKAEKQPKEARRTRAKVLELHSQRTAARSTVLIWKDFRLFRSILAVGSAEILAPYIVSGAVAYVLGSFWEVFRTAAVVSSVLGGIVFPFWSAHIVSTERLARTHRFLATLPVPRAKAVFARLLLVLLPVAALCALNATILLACNSRVPGSPAMNDLLTWEQLPQIPFLIMGFALTNGSCLGFAASWLLATRRIRPAIAIVSGLVMTPLSIGFWAALSGYLADAAVITPLQFARTYSCGAVIVAGAMALLGCRDAIHQADD